MRCPYSSLRYESCSHLMHRGVITCGLVALSQSVGPPGRSSPLAPWRVQVSAQKMSSAFARLSLPAYTQSRTGLLHRHLFNITSILIFVETMPQAIAEC